MGPVAASLKVKTLNDNPYLLACNKLQEDGCCMEDSSRWITKSGLVINWNNDRLVEFVCSLLKDTIQFRYMEFPGPIKYGESEQSDSFILSKSLINRYCGLDNYENINNNDKNDEELHL